MRKLILGVMGGALLLSGSAMADGIFDDTDPYLGLEYKHQWMNGKGDWDPIVPHTFHNGGLFFGMKFHDYWGLELGHNQSIKKSRDHTYGPAEVVFTGVAARPAGNALFTKTKVKVRTTYLDLNGFWPMNDDWDFLGTLGLGWTKAKYSNNGTYEQVAGGTMMDEYFDRTSAKTKVTARAGVGAEFKCNQWKFRGKVLWENTNRLRVENYDPLWPTKYYKDSISLALGISYYFFDK